MNLFKNKRVRANDTRDELAQKIAGSILTMQRRTAACLNRKAKHLSGRTLLFILIGFCTLSGSYLLYLLIMAVS